MKKTRQQKEIEKAFKDANWGIIRLEKLFEKHRTKMIYKQLKELSGL